MYAVVQRPSAVLGHPVGIAPGVPRVTYRPFSGAEDTLESMRSMILGKKGEHSVIVRQFTEAVLRDVEPKDYQGEILAIRNLFLSDSPWRPGAALFRYMNDPRHVEWVKTPERLVREIIATGSTVLDCDEATALAATMALQVGREAELVALGYDDQLSHVGVRVREPKRHKWLWLDSVAGPRERHAIASARHKVFRKLVRSLD